MALRVNTVAVLTALAANLVGWLSHAASAAGPEALTLERKIPLGEVSGRIDHFAVDLARQRLLVAELGNDTVGVLDLAQGRISHRITGLEEPQGVGYLPGVDVIYVANGGDGTVRRFHAADFATLDMVKLGDDADNIRYDAAVNQVIVGYGRGALAALDAASGKRLRDIPLAAHPESFRLEATGMYRGPEMRHPTGLRVQIKTSAGPSEINSLSRWRWGFDPRSYSGGQG